MSLVSGPYFISNVATGTYLGLGEQSGIYRPVENTNSEIPRTPVYVSILSTCAEANFDVLAGSSICQRAPSSKTSTPSMLAAEPSGTSTISSGRRTAGLWGGGAATVGDWGMVDRDIFVPARARNGDPGRYGAGPVPDIGGLIGLWLSCGD